MKQKELAALLGVSEAMVSRLVKKGMPTDSLERAQRWRKRHLEPGRMKGVRFNPNQPDPKPELLQPSASPLKVAGAAVAVNSVAVEQFALRVNAALVQDEPTCQLDDLRELLRLLPYDTAGDAGIRYADLSLPLRVWLALVDWGLAEDAPIRRAGDLTEVISLQELDRRVSPDCQLPGLWFECACDWGDASLLGLLPIEDDD